MFVNITNSVDTETDEYDSKYFDLEFICKEFNEKSVKFFGAIESLRNFGKLMYFMALPRKNEV